MLPQAYTVLNFFLDVEMPSTAIAAVWRPGRRSSTTWIRTSSLYFLPQPRQTCSPKCGAMNSQIHSVTCPPGKVNLAIIMDASRSVDHDERPFAVKFAIDTVSAFAELNLFKNGGTASYAEFATDVSDGRTFTSQDEFDEYVEGTPRMADNRSTNIIGGIAKGQELLLTSSVGTTSLMVVITDGKATTLTQGGATDPTVRSAFVALRAKVHCPLACPT